MLSLCFYVGLIICYYTATPLCIISYAKGAYCCRNAQKYKKNRYLQAFRHFFFKKYNYRVSCRRFLVFFWGLVGGSLGADVAPLGLGSLPPEMGSGVGVRRGAEDHSRAVDKGLSYRAPQMRKSFISSWYQSDRVRSLLRMQQISSLDCSTMPFFSTRTCRLAPFSGTVLMA